MKQFKKLVEVALSNSIQFVPESFRENYDQERIIEIFEKCKPFIFDNMRLDDSGSKLIHADDFADIELDAPFDVFSVEFSTEKALGYDDENGDQIEMKCIVVIENSQEDAVKYNSKFTIMGLLYHEKFDEYKVLISPKEPDTEACVKHVLKKLAKNNCGVLEGYHAISVPKNNSSKKKKQIQKDVFVVTSKKLYLKNSNKNKQKINFNHRWSVRGHWRYLDSLKDGKLGKNRNGERVEVGRTWVVAQERGDKTKPLIKKNRFVKS